jgi:hypothetical protein
MRKLLSALPFFLAAPLCAETYQHGNIIYDLPAGWSVGGVENGIRTILSDLPDDACEFCYIYLGSGGPKSGSLADYTKAAAPAFVDEDDRDQIQILQAPELSTLGDMTVALMGMLVDGDPYFVVGYELNDRYEVVAFQGYGGYEGDAIEGTMATFSDQVLPIFEGLQFVSEGATPLMPDPEPGDLAGVWWGWHYSNSFGIDGTVRIEIDHRRLVFWTDGYFYDGTPPAGLQPIDGEALMATGNDAFGTYLQSGSTLTLNFSTGTTETLTVNADGSLTDADRDLFAVEPLADGTVLDGGVSSFFFSGFTPGSGVEGGVTSASSTTFYPDGTYTGESFGGAFGNFVDGAGSLTGGFATDGGDDTTGGRYEIKDGLLIQYPANGAPPTMSMAILTSEGVMIDDQFLEKE